MWKNMYVKVVLYLFWLFNEKSYTTDRQKFGHKNDDCRPSMSNVGKKMTIDVQEKVK